MASEPDVPLPIKESFYRIAQEGMHNTIKHARATRIDLRLIETPEALRLELRDDGIGFESTGEFPGHLGLRSMQERVAAVQGTLTIESAPGAGTRIVAEMPRASA